MAIAKPKTFTLNQDLYHGKPRRKGDVITGAALAYLLDRMPHVLDETKPPKTAKKEEEVG